MESSLSRTRRAIVIFPPHNDMRAVEAVRQRFDPLAGRIAAHITLVFPFESDISQVDLKQHIKRATIGIRAFRVGFGQVVGTDDQYLFLALTEGAAMVAALHDRLNTGLVGEFLVSDVAFVPHITVGRLTNLADLTRALQMTRTIDFGVGTTASAVSAYKIDPQMGRSIEFEVSLA